MEAISNHTTALFAPQNSASLPNKQPDSTSHSRGWTLLGFNLQTLIFALSLFALTLSSRVWGQTTLNMQTATVYVNSGNFYDSQGSGTNYYNSESFTMTFYPAISTMKVKITFSSFATQDGYDGMMIYNGNSTASSVISSGLAAGLGSTTCPVGSWRGSLSGTSLPKSTGGANGEVTSTAVDGSLTIVFKSNASIRAAGWAASLSLTGNPCGGTFVDFGGSSGNYWNSVSDQITLAPQNAGDKIRLTFSSFVTEDGYDGMMIYNGNSTASPVISSGFAAGLGSTTCPAGSWRGSLSGASLPKSTGGANGEVTSTASDGTLTIVFKSDGWSSDAGWSAAVSCYSPCTAPSAPIVGLITQPTCETSTGIVALSGLPSSGSWTLTRSPGGTTTTGSGMTTTVSSLPANATYTFTVTNSSNCTSTASGNVTVNPQPTVPGQPSSITGTLDPVPGTAGVTYTVTNVAGTTYTWSVPAGWTITAGQNTNQITVTVGTTNGTISVTPSNACGNGTARTAATTIPNYRAQITGASYGASTWCTGESRSVSVTVKNTGVTTWTNSSPDINIGVKWATNGSNWNDYMYRQDAGSLAPGASQTYTFSDLQAKNATAAVLPPSAPTYGTNLTSGTNYLYFDVVYEGCFWFAWNPGTACSVTCSGNTVLQTSAITILAKPTSVNAGPDMQICPSQTVTLSGTPTTTLFSEDFESYQNTGSLTSSSSPWRIYEWTGSVNNWQIKNACSPNSGTRCLSIFDGTTDCSYLNTDNCDKVAYYSVPIDARDFTSTKLNFKWKASGESGWDYGYIMYSFDAVNWYYFSSTTLNLQTSWQTISNFNLSAVDGNQFYIGFEWINDDSDGGGIGLCIDDISITGTAACTYAWTPTTGLGTPSAITTTAAPTTTTTYTLTATRAGCTLTDQVVVSIRTIPAATAANNSPVCTGSPVNLTASNMAPSGQALTMANNATDLTSGVSNTANTANHTIEFWVNPNRTVVLHSQTNSGISGNLSAPTTEYCFAVYPIQGAFSGDVPTTAGVGVSVGTNGVEVVQHSANHFPVTLSYAATLSGWTHIAVVHISNVPYLYVNGNLVKVGLSSLYPTFPGSGVSMSYGYFSGSIDNLRTWSTSRSVSDILANMNLETPTSTTGLLQNLPFNGNGTALTGTSATINGSTYTTPTYYTYTWSGTSAPAAGTGTTQATGNLTNATSSATTSNYTVIATGGGCSGTSSSATTVTINPKPAINNMTASTCSSVAFTVTPVDVTNGVVPSGTSYTWSAPVVTGGITGGSSGSGSSITGTLVNTTGSAQTATYTVTPATSSCNGAAFTVTVTINTATPSAPASITGTAAQCPALTGQTYTAAASTGATTFTWTVPTGWTITAGTTTQTITVTTGSAGQNGNITVTASNSCGTSSAQTLAVTVGNGTPSTPASITGTSAQCPTLTGQTYSIASVANATTYTWTVPTGWTITAGAGSTTITVTTGSAGQNGNVTVTAGNSCGTSSAQTLAVTVGNGTPSTPASITGTSAQCPALTGQTYSIASVANATTYTWTVPTGWTITAGAGSTTITVTTGSAGQNGNITVTAGNSCGTSSAQTLAVTVSPANTAGSASSSPSLCINSALTAITIATTGASGIGAATGLPTGVSAAWASNTITISGTPTSSGVYNYSIPLTGGCGSVNATGTITVNAPVLAQSISPANGDYVWQGGISDAWGNTTNWLTYNGSTYVSANSVPNDVATRIFVPDYSGGCTTYDPTVVGSLSTDNITITVGAVLTVSNGATLNLSGNLSNAGTLTFAAAGTMNVEGGWVNNGTFNAGTGTVVFNGTTNASIVSGTNSFYNLSLNGGSALEVTLSNAVTVTNTLTLTSGKVVLGANNLNIGASGAISGGSSSSFVVTNSTGVLKQLSIDGSAAAGKKVFPIGLSTSSYTPMILANAGTSDDFSARVTSGVLQSGTSGNAITTKYINRTWLIDEALAGGSNATLTLGWNAAEEQGQFTRTACFVTHYTGGGWDLSTATSASGNPYTTFRSGITSFSPFTVTSTSALPIELISFQANCSDNNTVEITWSTATEHNTNYFRVDKSRDGMQWDVLNTIGAAGNSNYTIDYALTDAFPNPGINYYRLTQYDNDGVFETFDAQAAVCKDQQSGTALSSYPNPSSGDFNVDLQTDELEGEATLLITDAKGAVVHSQDIKIIKGNNNFVIQKFNAEPGIYYITVKAGASTVTTKHSMR